MTVHSVRGLRAFRHRNYQLFFGGQLISLIGTWMQQVAQAWLVLELTNDAFWLGVVASLAGAVVSASRGGQREYDDAALDQRVAA